MGPLTLGTQEFEVHTPEELRAHLTPLRGGPHAEVWWKDPERGCLCLLSDGDRAFLMHLPGGEGDHPGWTTRAAGEADGTAEFTLSNGQVDSLPAAWVVPLDAALDAPVHFALHGTRAPWLTWHDDSPP